MMDFLRVHKFVELVGDAVGVCGALLSIRQAAALDDLPKCMDPVKMQKIVKEREDRKR